MKIQTGCNLACDYLLISWTSCVLLPIPVNFAVIPCQLHVICCWKDLWTLIHIMYFPLLSLSLCWKGLRPLICVTHLRFSTHFTPVENTLLHFAETHFVYIVRKACDYFLMLCTSHGHSPTLHPRGYFYKFSQAL